MMTNGPAATIGDILHVDLPRPRNRVQLADDARYNHFRHEVLTFLYEKMGAHKQTAENKSTTNTTDIHRHKKSKAA